jgi:ABC-type transport system involved in multi-copper enzyme maturation permease subunit
MIWLTWRQARTQTLVVAALLAAFGVLLLVSGPHLVSLYRESTLAACHRECAGAAGNFLDSLGANGFYHQVYLLGAVLLILLPVVIGLFWGAPLIARELESGTFRLAWNQTVTRERWLAVKLGALGLASMALAGLFSLILGWWASPIDKAAALGGAAGIETRFFPVLFGARGVAPIGYAALAFVLGVLIGLIVRRTVPAMAITVAVIAVVQIAFPLLVRPHLVTPVRSVSAVTAASLQGLSADANNQQLQSVFVNTATAAGAWVISSNVTTASGSASLGTVPQACQPSGGRGPQACFTALAQRHYKSVITYDPANRYWTFQWLEFGIYLTVALLLAWACFWWTRRRLG